MIDKLGLDKALTTPQTTGSSLLQAVLIILVLGFIVWNVKLALEDVE
ncbi:hypothetical protein [Oceanirhabdus sp. W0125-5]|nr:hypothetical protein [Oceanirhabdus sp. W0125-5]WBW97465.1 hypothetical protein OW730_01000 [Oceanirhabdus sp. W0125-5]